MTATITYLNTGRVEVRQNVTNVRCLNGETVIEGEAPFWFSKFYPDDAVKIEIKP